MFRVLLATFVSAAVAVAVVALFAVFDAGDSDTPGAVLLHFGLFGGLIAFPIAFLIGVPLYYLFQWRGWLSRPAVLVGGTALALVYPLVVLWVNELQGFSFWFFFVCAVAGVSASMVFIRISPLRHVQGQL